MRDRLLLAFSRGSFGIGKGSNERERQVSSHEGKRMLHLRFPLGYDGRNKGKGRKALLRSIGSSQQFNPLCGGKSTTEGKEGWKERVGLLGQGPLAG